MKFFTLFVLTIFAIMAQAQEETTSRFYLQKLYRIKPSDILQVYIILLG